MKQAFVNGTEVDVKNFLNPHILFTLLSLVCASTVASPIETRQHFSIQNPDAPQSRISESYDTPPASFAANPSQRDNERTFALQEQGYSPLLTLLDATQSILPKAEEKRQLTTSHPNDSHHAGSRGEGSDSTLDSACLNTQAEASAKRLESQLLGAEHAAEHAQARAERCYAARHPHPEATSHKQSRHSSTSSLGPVSQFIDQLTNIHTYTASFGPLGQFLTRLIGTASAAIGTPSQVGQWSPPSPLPIVGTHATLLPTGKVLFWSYKPDKTNNAGVAYLWNPMDGSGREVDPPNNIWCGGQTVLADGRVLVVGGNLAYRTTYEAYRGLNQIYTFNPFNETWTRQPDMRQGRWYPTVTELADGRAVITSGYTETGDKTINQDVEVFTPSPNLDGVGTVTLVGSKSTTDFYPHQFVLPNGKLLLAGPGRADSALLDPSTWSWSDIPNLLEARKGNGNGVLLPGGPSGSYKVLLIGGKSAYPNVSATSELFDAANPSAGWQYRASLPQPRHAANTVILPDGALLTVGGNSGYDHYTDPQREAELYDPVSNAWTPMTSQVESRAYHSTALLLPDGRVLSAGDDGAAGGGNSTDTVELFSPPYLFRAPQPTISAAPTMLTWGQSFSIQTPDSVVKAVLIAPGAVTHGNDMHQRYVPLAISPIAGGVTALSPPSANVAPPGYYMLFLVNSQGVPSKAKWVRLTNITSTLQFSAASYSVNENGGTATIIVTRGGSRAGVISAKYATSNGTATAGSDYMATSGILSFADGVTSKSFVVPVISDRARESNETVNLTLSSPTGGASLGSPGTAVLTIINNKDKHRK